MGDAIIELAGQIAENTTYSIASQPEYGTVTVDQHTGSWLYTINQGVTESRDYGGFKLAMNSDGVVTILNSGAVGLRDKAVAGGNVNNWIAGNDSGDYMGKDAEIIITPKSTGYYLLRCFGGGQSGNFDI